MIEILLFSLSISIDALGYGASLSTRKVSLSRLEFFLINCLNSIILLLFIIAFSYTTWIGENQFAEKLSSCLLFLIGIYYIISAFVKLFKKNIKNIDLNVNNSKKISLSDLIVILLVFIFEDIFSAFVFHTNFNDKILFIVSNFIFHYFFFLFGYDVGKKIVLKMNIDSTFISGYIFLLLVCFNL